LRQIFSALLCEWAEEEVKEEEKEEAQMVEEEAAAEEEAKQEEEANPQEEEEEERVDGGHGWKRIGWRSKGEKTKEQRGRGGGARGRPPADGILRGNKNTLAREVEMLHDIYPPPI
jgi:hypothetical protein